MRAVAGIEIAAPPEAVWRIVSDFENASKTVRAIEKVEVMERPASGLVGFKWRETRTMFGKQATEVMWVTAASEPSHYDTRAESHGAIYTTRVALAPRGDGTRLTMEFEGRPVTFGARLAWGLMGFMFKGATRKALAKDLEDIKAKVESAS